MSEVSKEKRTLTVIILTLITMAAEIVIGYITHSMALFADGWHMGTHAFALTITFLTYVFIRKLETSDRFAFGTGKFSTLSGFASSILLGLTGIAIIFESVDRVFNPLSISFNEAIIVAIIGLIINSACILIMGGHSHHHHHHSEHEHEDFNYKSAYMHILADAMTSIFAITALIAGKYLGLGILDPIVGIIGGSVICIWAYNLIKSTSGILIDTENKTVKDKITEKLKEYAIFKELHVWNTSEEHVSVAGKYLEIQPADIEKIIKEITECDYIILEKITS